VKVNAKGNNLISFQPSDDPYGIKKDDLVTSLRKCLAATNQFAPVSFLL